MIVILSSDHLGKDIAISSLHVSTAATSSNLEELQKCKSVPEQQGRNKKNIVHPLWVLWNMNMLLQVLFSILFFQSSLQSSNEARILISSSKSQKTFLLCFPISLPELVLLGFCCSCFVVGFFQSCKITVHSLSFPPKTILVFICISEQYQFSALQSEQANTSVNCCCLLLHLFCSVH